MKFETEGQKKCYKKVVPIMKELFGEFAAANPEAPMFYISLGSAVATTAIMPWGEDDAIVATRSYVVTDVELTPELLRFLLEQNNQMRFGSFGLENDGSIFLDYSVIGSTIDKKELKACVLAVARAADEFDDKIVSRWGGQRACDRSG